MGKIFAWAAVIRAREADTQVHDHGMPRASRGTMERRRITCPETARFELIDYERTPLGAVIAGCSRFLPRCALTCTRECAAQMDHRCRRDDRPDLEGEDSPTLER
jgi:hypothetical protein